MNQEDLKRNYPILILAYLRYSDLFPKIKPTINELQKRLRCFDFFETILILSKINLLFSDIKSPHHPSLQIYLSRWFLNEYTLSRLSKKFDGHTLLFHRHQMLFMMKNAFMICQHRPAMKFNMDHLRHKLGTCFLITNDLLPLLKLDENELDKQELDKKKELIWKESLPGWELNNPPDLMLVISRMRKIFREIVASYNNNDTFLDLNAIFQTASKLSIDEFMFFVFGLLSIYLNNRKEILNNPSVIYIYKDRLLDKVKKDFPRDKLERFFEFVSLPIGQYQAEIPAAKDLSYNYGFLPFRKRPIVDLDQNVYFCLDFYFLLEKIATGIFWTINDSLEGNQKEKFHVFWGLLFEKYINKLIEESLDADSCKFYSRPCYENTKDEIADGILLSEEDLVIFEHKFTILTQEAKFENSVDSLTNEIKLKFEKNKEGEWKGYGQLANSINKLFSKSGQFSCREINKQKIRRIFPVLIVYEHVLQTPFTNYIFNRSFQNLLDRSSLIDHVEIYPLTVMTIEDFEKSLPFLSNFSSIINKRIQSDNSLDFSFSDFLKIKFARERIKRPDVLHFEYHKFSDEIKAYFFDNK